MARPRTYDDAVRDRLLERASEAISHSGPDGLSLRAVAREADTTTAAVYSLFGSRDALVAGVVAEGFRRFARHLAAVATTGDPAADLLALGSAYRDSAVANPHFYRVMFATIPAPVATSSGETPAGSSSGSSSGAASAPAATPEGAAAHPAEPLARPTFLVLLHAVERVLQAQGRSAEEAPDIAVRLWALAHGLVSLELGGLLPGDPAEREARYLAALRASRI